MSDGTFIKHNGAMTKEDKEKLLLSGFKDTKPAERNEEYYKKRPCLAMIMEACDILDRILFEDKQE